MCLSLYFVLKILFWLHSRCIRLILHWAVGWYGRIQDYDSVILHDAAILFPYEVLSQSSLDQKYKVSFGP